MKSTQLVSNLLWIVEVFFHFSFILYVRYTHCPITSALFLAKKKKKRKKKKKKRDAIIVTIKSTRLESLNALPMLSGILPFYFVFRVHTHFHHPAPPTNRFQSMWRTLWTVLQTFRLACGLMNHIFALIGPTRLGGSWMLVLGFSCPVNGTGSPQDEQNCFKSHIWSESSIKHCFKWHSLDSSIKDPV